MHENLRADLARKPGCKRIEGVGFGTLRRVLDQLHKGLQDPSTWPDLNVTLPGGREPGPKPPNPRDNPPDIGRLGAADPSRSSMAERGSGRDGSSVPQRHYFARSTVSSMPRPITDGTNESLSKDELLHSTLQAFRDMPDEMFNHAQVKHYMAGVVKLITTKIMMR